MALGARVSNYASGTKFFRQVIAPGQFYFLRSRHEFSYIRTLLKLLSIRRPSTFAGEFLINVSFKLVKLFKLYNSAAVNHGGLLLMSIWSLVTTLYVFGGMLGAFSIGFLADKFGRKMSVIMTALPTCLGALLSYLSVASRLPILLLFGRFVTGISCGAATQLGPMYLLEIVPFNLKGAMGTCHMLLITMGIFAGSVFGLDEILGSEFLWPFLFLLNIIPGLLSLIVFPFLPESPRYLMLVKKDKNATELALRWLRRRWDVSGEMKEMENESQSEKSEKSGIVELLKSSELRPALTAAVVLQLMQQFSGINAIFFYSTSIYERAGVRSGLIRYANVGTCAVNVLVTVIAVPLMDRAGRRSLLLYPTVFVVLFLATITAALRLRTTYYWMNFVSITCIIGHVSSYALGLGPIPSMITAELFRQGHRGKAMSVTGLVNMIVTAMVAMGFELMQTLMNEFVFLIFLVITVLCLVFVYFKVPETKNKTFDEIANQFKSSGQSTSDLPMELR